jgi:hypothetical protein
MPKQKLYAVSMLALWLGPDWIGYLDEETGTVKFYPYPSRGYGNVELEHQFTLAVDVAFAVSEDEAKEKCLERLKEKYPESDGWVSHIAGAMLFDISPQISAALLERGIRPKENIAAIEDEEPDLSEMVM